jgi:hypothetical protein
LIRDRTPFYRINLQTTQAKISKAGRIGLQKYNLGITLIANSSCWVIVSAVILRQTDHELIHSRAAEKSFEKYETFRIKVKILPFSEGSEGQSKSLD